MRLVDKKINTKNLVKFHASLINKDYKEKKKCKILTRSLI